MSDASPAEETDSGAPGGSAFWTGLALGGAVMAFGIGGLVRATSTDAVASVGRWVVGADLVHDLVLAPLVVVLGCFTARAVPARVRGPVQAGLLATGVVLLVGWVPWRGDGRVLVPDNPSVQPLDYTSAVLTVLGFVWIAVAAWIALRLLADRDC